MSHPYSKISPQNHTMHGLSRTPEYKIWIGIKSRSHSGAHHKSKPYIGRGIRIHQDWADSFLLFLEHIGKRPSPNHSVERIDNNRGYEPGNVRWATRAEQGRNTRRNRIYTYNGMTMCLQDWATHLGIDKVVLRRRLDDPEWTMEKAFTEPMLPFRSSRSPEEVRKQGKASQAVARAIRAGVLSRPTACPKCSRSDKPIHVIHPDGFDRQNWLNVIWLCTQCKSDRRRDLVKIST